MKRARSVLVGLGLVAWVVGHAPAAGAEIIVLDFDGAPKGDFVTTPHIEDGASVAVDSGHYELVADGTGPDGDQALNIDDENLGLSQVTLSPTDGRTFDVVSLDVVNPAEAPGEVTISAVGGGGGSISAPTVTGLVSFDATFAGVSALVITQNSAGAFAIDDVTIQALPEPGALPSLLASFGLLWVLHRRRCA